MHIIGQLDNPNIKITLFDQNNKLTVKFEKGQAEIIIKFSEDKTEVMNQLHKENDYTNFAMIEKQLDAILIFRNKFEIAPPSDESVLDII